MLIDGTERKLRGNLRKVFTGWYKIELFVSNLRQLIRINNFFTYTIVQ